MNFVLELLIHFFFFFIEREFYLLELCMITEKTREGASALSSPQFLIVTRLFKGNLLESRVRQQELRQSFQAIVSQNSDIKLLDVCVAIDGFDDMSESNGLEADLSEG